MLQILSYFRQGNFRILSVNHFIFRLYSTQNTFYSQDIFALGEVDPNGAVGAETVFLLELVDRNVVRKKEELLVGTGSVKWVFQASVGLMASRAAPEIHFPRQRVGMTWWTREL